MTVTQALETALAAKAAAREPGSPLRLSASGKCARYLAYWLHFPELIPPPTPRGLAIFELGQAVHDWVRGYLAAAFGERFHSVEREVELEVAPGLRVRGHTDGILETGEGPLLLDIKTASARSAQRMHEQGVPYEYRAQLNAYLEASGLERGALLVYVKDTSEMFELPVRRDPAVVEQVRRRFLKVAQSTPQALPEREYARQSLACAWCPLQTRCWEGR
jgi:RecB family exonuclease